MILRPAATVDIEDAYAWYEAQRAGLGQEFRASVDAALLPFGLFYRLIDEQVVVVACMHAKRDPRSWRARR